MNMLLYFFGRLARAPKISQKYMKKRLSSVSSSHTRSPQSRSLILVRDFGSNIQPRYLRFPTRRLLMINTFEYFFGRLVF